MGMFKISTGGSYIENPGNPNPSLFVINRVMSKGDYLAARVMYPGCTNFEGRKILVFRYISTKCLSSVRELDPHFTENSKLIARFLPTSEGWEMARTFIKAMDELNK